MISGVKTKVLKCIPDSRGRLMEILRCDDTIFKKFGQVYLTTVYPGVVKGWHYHKKQVDNFVCVSGMIKLVLYDNRKKSPTYKSIEEFFIGVHNPMLVQIPTDIYHGFKAIGLKEALVINVPTLPYNQNYPDEYRLDSHSKKIPYSWERVGR